MVIIPWACTCESIGIVSNSMAKVHSTDHCAAHKPSSARLGWVDPGNSADMHFHACVYNQLSRYATCVGDPIV